MEVLSNLNLSNGTQINFLGDPNCVGTPKGANSIIKKTDNGLDILAGCGFWIHIGSEFSMYACGGKRVFDLSRACNGFNDKYVLCTPYISASEFSLADGCIGSLYAANVSIASEFKIAVDVESIDKRLFTITDSRSSENGSATIALDIEQDKIWNKTEFLVTKTQLEEVLDNLPSAGQAVNHLEFENPTIPANCSLYEVSLAPTPFTKTPIMQLTNKSGAAQVADLCYNKTSNKVFVGIDHTTQITAGEYKLSVFGM
jgi:hypothetical protein